MTLHDGNLDNAAALCKEGLDFYRERAYPNGIAHGIAHGIAAYAELRRVQGHTELAVRLLALPQLGPALQTGITIANRIERERSIAAARAELDPDAFNTAWEAGQKLTLEQAIALAQKEPRA